MSHSTATTLTWLTGIAASLILHVGSVTLLSKRSVAPPPKVHGQAKIKIVEVKAPEPPKAEPPPPPPKPKPPKPKELKPKVATERPKAAEPPKTPPPPPVQGFSAAAMGPGGKVAVPLGNTLLAPDTGQRLKSEPAPLQGDLSSDPELVRTTFKEPAYTDAAVDANLEGVATIDVFVDETGKVTQAELRKPIGFGMDQRLLDSAYQCRFKPRRNRFGKAEAGWSQIQARLVLP